LIGWEKELEVVNDSSWPLAYKIRKHSESLKSVNKNLRFSHKVPILAMKSSLNVQQVGNISTVVAFSGTWFSSVNEKLGNFFSEIYQ